MTVGTSTSFLLSTTLIVLLLASMQLYKVHLASNELMTIVGGLLGSSIFVFLVTAIGNLETLLFGEGFQTKLFPEIVGALLVSMMASASVHRVSATTCVLFSISALYYMNRVSQKLYSTQGSSTSAAFVSKKKK